MLPEVRVVGTAKPTGVKFNTSLAKQPSDPTISQTPSPQGKGKRSYQKAVRQALRDGSAVYKGRQMNLRELGGAPATLKAQATSRGKPSKFLDKQQLTYLSWNAGSLTTAVWEELLSLLKTPSYAGIRIVAIQETHWRGDWQFTKDGWHVISSGSSGEKSAGVLIMVHSSLCKSQQLKFNEVIPGRILHVRVPGEDCSLDVLSCYQHVWRSKDTLTANKESRSLFLAKLNTSIKGLPLRNTLLILGDFNMSLRTDMRHVGPCATQSCRLGHRGSQGLQRMLEEHNLVAANTWGVRKPATHEQGNSVSQVDYALLRSTQSGGPGKHCQPQRQFPVAKWRGGSRHFPLVGKVQHSRSYSAQVSKPYDQQAMEDSYRNRSGAITAYGHRVDELIAHSDPSWDALRQAMETALIEFFPRKSKRKVRLESPWETRMALSNLPVTILAISDLHKELRQRVILRCWRSVAQHQKSARTAKHLKKERRQKAMDECMEQAEARSQRDGSHSLYKIIRQFRTCKLQERVQLRDEHGCFLSSEAEASLLHSYSETLFGTGADFPLTGRQDRLELFPTEVKEQLSSIKIGKAVPRGSPPVVAWRSLGPQAHQHAAAVLNREIEQGSLSTTVTSSQISWLPKPPKKPDKPESLRPIGVIAPEGKIFAGALRKRLKPALQTAMQGLPQFGFVPGRGTEEAICKALSHVDEARQRAALIQPSPGRGHQGLQLKGSLTLSVDMSKAFDMVDRVRLREALEASAADPLIIEVVGLLHINALYRMTASDKEFDIAKARNQARL